MALAASEVPDEVSESLESYLAGEPGGGWRPFRLRVEEIWTDGLLTGSVNRWLEARLGIHVLSIQYRTAIGPDGTSVSSALIIYREEVPADGAGGE